MYAKIFRQIYDGTLAESWQALVTFQQLLILADDRGVVDMTPGAIHRITGIPRDIIDAGLDILSKPDPNSRSTEEEGRRIVLLDTDRPWGWRLVNYNYYRNLATREEKREADRARIADKRKKNSDVADSRKESQPVAKSRAPSEGVANVAQEEAEADTEADLNTTSAEQPSCSPPVITLPLNDGSAYPISEEQVRVWSHFYPAVDVIAELRKMAGWLQANPKRRKTKSGITRFANNWLARQQDRGGLPHETHPRPSNSAVDRVRRANADRLDGRVLDGDATEIREDEPETSDVD